MGNEPFGRVAKSSTTSFQILKQVINIVCTAEMACIEVKQLSNQTKLLTFHRLTNFQALLVNHVIVVPRTRTDTREHALPRAGPWDRVEDTRAIIVRGRELETDKM